MTKKVLIIILLIFVSVINQNIFTTKSITERELPKNKYSDEHYNVTNYNKSEDSIEKIITKNKKNVIICSNLIKVYLKEFEYYTQTKQFQALKIQLTKANYTLERFRCIKEKKNNLNMNRCFYLLSYIIEIYDAIDKNTSKKDIYKFQIKIKNAINNFNKNIKVKGNNNV